MITAPIRITAPARLHFGLFAFGDGWERQYGGVGTMVAAPRIELLVATSSEFQATGPAAERVAEFSQLWAEYYAIPRPNIHIHVDALPPQHSGLGVGTQLGLSVAAACQSAVSMTGVSPVDWAASVGRAQRSAIGTYGFLQGGLIAERGRTPAERISPLEVRCDVPAQWRFLLLRPKTNPQGLSGSSERKAFRISPSVPKVTRDQLIRLAHERLIPAAIQADWTEFSAALYEYGHMAGECFSKVQGGAYNGESVSEIVEFVRGAGLPGVGQSSWGPTVFAMAESESQAQNKMEEINERFADVEIVVSPPDNTGVQVVANPADSAGVVTPASR